MAKNKNNGNNGDGNGFNPEETEKKLREISTKLQIEDLNSSLAEAFVTAAKTTDENGLITYKVDNGKKAALAKSMVDAFTYHRLRRNLGMSGEGFNTILGLIGKESKFGEEITEKIIGVDYPGLEKVVNQQKDISLNWVTQSGLKMYEPFMKEEQGKIMKDIKQTEGNIKALQTYLEKKGYEGAKEVWDFNSLMETYMKALAEDVKKRA